MVGIADLPQWDRAIVDGGHVFYALGDDKEGPRDIFEGCST